MVGYGLSMVEYGEVWLSMVKYISQYRFHQCGVSGNPQRTARHLEDPVHLRSPSSFRAIVLVLTHLLLKTMGELETI